MRAFILVLVLASGCAPLTADLKLPAVQGMEVDVGACAAEEASEVMAALTGGLVDWVPVVATLIHCVPTVVKDIEAVAKVAGPGGVGLTQEGERRVRFAKMLAHMK